MNAGEASSSLQFKEAKINETFSSNLWAYTTVKELNICLQYVVKKQDVLGHFTNWFSRSFIFHLLPWILKEMRNWEHSTVFVVTSLGSIIRTRLSSYLTWASKRLQSALETKKAILKVLSVGDRTIGESFWVCCPGATSNSLFLKELENGNYQREILAESTNVLPFLRHNQIFCRQHWWIL